MPQLKEGQEIYIEFNGKKYLVTPNPFDDSTMELREGNHDDGFDVLTVISSLDEIFTVNN